MIDHSMPLDQAVIALPVSAVISRLLDIELLNMELQGLFVRPLANTQVALSTMTSKLSRQGQPSPLG